MTSIISLLAIIFRRHQGMHWATLGLIVDFLIRLVAGPGPSVLTQLARLPLARMKPQFTYGQLICSQVALFHPEMSIFVQKCHPYTENLNSETPGDSKNAFLHCGDVSDIDEANKRDYLLTAG